MNTYLIKIDNKYLVGTNEDDFGKVPNATFKFDKLEIVRVEG